MRDTYRCVPALSDSLRAAVYKLRYIAYRESDNWKNDLGAGPGYQDAYDANSNCVSFALFREGQEDPIGGIRTGLYHPEQPHLHIPAFDHFKDEITAELTLNRPIVQSSHFVLSPSIRQLDLTPKLLLIREILRCADQHGARFIISVVRNKPSLLRFYSLMGLLQLGKPKHYPDANLEGVLIASTLENMVKSARVRLSLRLMADFDMRHPIDGT